MSSEHPKTLGHTLLTALLALVFGFLGAAVWSYSGLADNRTRTFLLANPDLLPQMAEAFEAQEAAKRLTEMGGEVFTPFPGVVLGNPQGKTVLVEFTDYNCPYCEASLKDVKRLVAEDPDLKVVIREWPIFEGSDVASRMALAAGLQGKYRAFHDAMFQLELADFRAIILKGEVGRITASKLDLRGTGHRVIIPVDTGDLILQLQRALMFDQQVERLVETLIVVRMTDRFEQRGLLHCLICYDVI